MNVLAPGSKVLTWVRCSVTACILLFATSQTGLASSGPPKVGAAAPVFTGLDADGNVVDLSTYRGQKVILEWTNHDCPYVRKHYDESQRNMQTMQSETTGDGAVWLSVISSAPGKQGFVSGDEAKQLSETRGAAPTAVVLDPDGTIGRLYDAKTTPHMFVIDELGLVQYMGAIDSKRSSNPSDIPSSTNYVAKALDELSGGSDVSEPVTQPYGCSVKYGS